MKMLIGIVVGLAIIACLYFLLRGGRASAGPNGGDIVPLQDGTTKAELLANADTGELMVHTWDKDLKQPRSIKSEPLTIGSGQQSVDLSPYPIVSDPPGFCSRFYGRADWARGGGIHQGWMHPRDQAADHHDFAWNGCWKAGRSHGAMWAEMGKHRDGMMGHGPGHRGMAGDTHNGPNRD
jgi:hypothetical protein